MTEFILFLGLGLIGAFAVLPYQFSMMKEKIDEDRRNYPTKKIPPLPILKLISFFQTGILIGIAAFFGVKIAPIVGLDWPIINFLLEGTPIPYPLPSTLFWSVVIAILTVLFIVRLDLLFMKNIDSSKVKIPSRKQAITASFYGGLSEEIITRLFFMSLIVFLSTRLGFETSAYWIGIIVAALLFGLLHLPAAIGLFGKSPLVIGRTITLNFIPGIIFGYLFWKYGIEIAMFTHFCADILLHAVFAPYFNKKKEIKKNRKP
ncbi:CPBP family intramembrane metalloprotease [Cytobacillus suaedae]|nr:CPBP family intramembrane metalloprotease [Cytobacillus suaedae]